MFLCPVSITVSIFVSSLYVAVCYIFRTTDNMMLYSLCALLLSYVHWRQCLAASSATADSWQKYIRGPSSRIVYPASVVSNYTTGNVTNPEGLVNDQGPTILTRTPTDTDIPTIVLYFGINVVGYINITFGGASDNSPGIRLAFSETTTYLTN